MEETKNELDEMPFGMDEANLLRAVNQQHGGNYMNFALSMLKYADDQSEVKAAIWALKRAEEKQFRTEWAAEMQPRPFLDVQIPDFMTLAQARSVLALYKRNPDGAASLAHFMNRVRPTENYVSIYPWCGMYIGIEKDGHTHS